MPQDNVLFRGAPFFRRQEPSHISLVVEQQETNVKTLQPREEINIAAQQEYLTLQENNFVKHDDFSQKTSPVTAITPAKISYRLQELDYPNDNIKRIQRNDGFRHSINGDVMTAIGDQIAEFADRLCAEFGVKCCRVYHDNSKESGTIKIKISTVNTLKQDIFARDLIKSAHEIGMKPQHYGAEIIYNNQQLIITGADIEERQVRVMSPDGDALLSVEQVLELLPGDKPITIEHR